MDDVFVLSNGVEIPKLCYGCGITWLNRNTRFSENPLYTLAYMLNNTLRNRKQLKLDLAVRKVTKSAMKNGCHMFDTSRAYAGSEYALGNYLKHYNRSEYFMVTKLSNHYQYKGDVRACLEKSLHDLKMDYVDLYLMHWPVKDKFVDSWKQMETLYDDGLCRAIGVCNCNIHHLETLEKHSSIIPMVNQFECHPLFTQNELRHYCSEKNIQVMAYTSTGRMDGRLMSTALPSISNKYNKTIAQVILRWHQQIGNIPVVNTTNPKHLLDNININDFSLSFEDVERILNININSRLRYDPDNCDFRRL